MNAWPAGVILTSEDLLLDFIGAAENDSRAAVALQEMTVQLRASVSSGVLWQSLAVATFLTDLVLLLPVDTPIGLLDRLQFPHLELFKTDLPHHHLLPFLTSHGSLTDLCLDACHRGAGELCPLSSLDLGHITSVECPAGCVPGVAHSELLRLTAQGQRHHTPDVPSLLKSLRAPLSSLLALTLDIFPDDYDILRSVILCAPNVETLKLLERPQVQRRKAHARRAWNDVGTWSCCLARLGSLGDFALRTSSTFVRSPTVACEKKKLLRWAMRASRGTSTTKHHIHPTLTSLRVWYRSGEPGGGVLTYWSRSTGTWRNIARVADPALDTPF